MVLPLLFLKVLLNHLYFIIIKKSKIKSTSEYFSFVFMTFINMIIAFPIVFVSFMADFINLPGLLLEDERYFEFKYQDELEHMDDTQRHTVLITFEGIMYKDFSKFRGLEVNMLESMI